MSRESSSLPSRKGLFVCGTDTHVGKTYVSCQIVESLVSQQLSVGVYKPVASGGLCSKEQLLAEDAEKLGRAAAQEDALTAICPQVFAAPLAPPLAAAEEGRHIDTELLRTGLDYWTARSEVVVVEGVGGLLSPLSEEDFTVTLAKEFGYPIVLVVANRLGAINQVLQALCVLETYARDVPVAGIVLNQVDPQQDSSCAANGQQICQHSSTPLLAEIAWQSPAPLHDIDWQALASGTHGARSAF